MSKTGSAAKVKLNTFDDLFGSSEVQKALQYLSFGIGIIIDNYKFCRREKKYVKHL